MILRHFFSFTEHGKRFEVTAERIENIDPYPGHDQPWFAYKMENGHPRLKELESQEPDRPLARESISPEESILSQVRDPERYPLLAYLSDFYTRIRMYREWSFGRYTPPRQAQKADLPAGCPGWWHAAAEMPHMMILSLLMKIQASGIMWHLYESSEI